MPHLSSTIPFHHPCTPDLKPHVLFGAPHPSQLTGPALVRKLELAAHLLASAQPDVLLTPLQPHSMLPPPPPHKAGVQHLKLPTFDMAPHPAPVMWCMVRQTPCQLGSFSGLVSHKPECGFAQRRGMLSPGAAECAWQSVPQASTPLQSGCCC